jgi:hypothetical protein
MNNDPMFLDGPVGIEVNADGEDYDLPLALPISACATSRPPPTPRKPTVI